MKLFTAIGCRIDLTLVWKLEQIWLPVYFIKTFFGALPEGDYIRKWIELCDNIGVSHFKEFKPQEEFINLNGIQLISTENAEFQNWLMENVKFIHLIMQTKGNCILTLFPYNEHIIVFNDKEKYVIIAMHIDGEKMAWFEMKKIISLFNYKCSYPLTKTLKRNEIKKWNELSNARFVFHETEFISEQALNKFLVMSTKNQNSFQFKNWIISYVIPEIYKKKYSLKPPNSEASTQTDQVKIDGEMINCFKSELNEKFKNFNLMVKALNNDLYDQFIKSVKNIEEDLLENTLNVFKFKNNEYKFYNRQRRAIPQMMKEVDDKGLLIYSRNQICSNLDIIKSVKLFLKERILRINKHSIWMNIQIPLLNAVLDKICDNQNLVMDIVYSKKDLLEQLELQEPMRQLEEEPMGQLELQEPMRQLEEEPMGQLELQEPMRQLEEEPMRQLELQEPMRQLELQEPMRQLEEEPMRQLELQEPMRQLEEEPMRQLEEYNPLEICEVKFMEVL
ncbi:hypothetical protein TNCV_148411 [Trichonephila clavipes]|nr:hypothetical protein TNCV_148411 [Trichonephila clavipes]